MTFDDVQFVQNMFALAPLSNKFSARIKDGTLALMAPSGPASEANHGRPAKSVIWEGPIEKAQFVLQSLSGITTIFDASGQVIWSDAEENSKFDLQINRDSTGKAELIDSDGATLWSGNLKSTKYGSCSYVGGADHYTMQVAGLTIEGDKQSARITEDPCVRIWSGPLPSRPTVAINDCRRYLHFGPYGFDGGSDRKIRFQFTDESGEVTVDNEDHAPLGRRTVPFLRMDSTSLSMRETTQGETSKSEVFPPEFFMPRAELSIDGIVYVTYRDSAGKVLHRFRAYKAGNATGYLTPKS